jgi:hypothetical protein
MQDLIAIAKDDALRARLSPAGTRALIKGRQAAARCHHAENVLPRGLREHWVARHAQAAEDYLLLAPMGERTLIDVLIWQ